ncbi:MAG TPA: hypothetical protein VF473_03075 [Cyclobacteriaceae bacterium]
MIRSILLSLILTALVLEIRAQEKPAKIDTLFVPRGYMVVLEDTSFVVKNDTVVIGHRVRIRQDPYQKSVKFYDSLEEKAKRSRVTQELHEMLIRKQRRPQTIDSVIIRSEDSYQKYNGMIIRSIRVKTTDLLEGSVLDTVLVATSQVGKLVNQLHSDTRHFIVRNNLLFKVGDRVDPFRLADNERLLRQFKTIRDARIYLKAAEGTENEVDLVVVTQDVASVGATGSYSSFNKFALNVYNINILGYATQLTMSYFRNTAGHPVNGYEVALRQPNFGHSFISGELKYTDNYLRNRTSIIARRDFLTPRMKYAGGFEVFRTHENYVINRNDTLPQPYRQESVDVWLGRSFPLAPRTNFIVAVRTNDYRFTSRPVITRDSNFFFYDRNTILGGLTLFKTNYIKGSLIQGFGKTEDVPVNTWIGTTFGPEYNDFTTRHYVDVHGGMGRYFTKSGYFYGELTISGFRTNSVWEDGVINFNSRYFSNMMPAGRAKVRQFVNFSFIKGYNRTVYQTLILPRGWRDSRGFVPTGDQRMTLGFETVYFTRWYYYGFKVALYHGADFNFIGLAEKIFNRESIFPSLKGGIRMLNDNLVFPTLSIDVNYYIRTAPYKPAFSIAISTSLPRLFGAPQSFKPQVASFQ